MAVRLTAISSNTLVTIVGAVEADKPLREELVEQLEMETVARDDAEMTCQEAASVLREASAHREHGATLPDVLVEGVDDRLGRMRRPWHDDEFVAA